MGPTCRQVGAELLGRSPAAPRLTRPVARYGLRAPPTRFPSSWGLPGRDVPRRYREGAHHAPAWLVLEVETPRSEPASEDTRLDSPGIFAPYDTFRQKRSGRPADSHPRHLPSSGFGHPLDGLLPLMPGSDPSVAAASLGFPLQGLAPPGRRYPSRGLASLVVYSARFCPLGRDSRGYSDPERGPTTLRLVNTKRRPPNLALLGLCPSRHSPPSPRHRLPGALPSYPFGRKCSLRFHFRAGLQGFDVRQKRLASLETACLLGFLHFRSH